MKERKSKRNRLKVEKRDGRLVPFEVEKILNAVEAAFKETLNVQELDEVSEEKVAKVTAKVVKQAKNSENKIVKVENIQDLIEDTLLKMKETAIAKNFIGYRRYRTEVREANTQLMKDYKNITFGDAENYDIKRENANVDGNTAMGTMLQYGTTGSKQFAINHILEKKHSLAFKEGRIHIHDLDFEPTGTLTCSQIDFAKLARGGFSTGHGHLREPQDITSYAALAAIAIQSNQNDQHGGQSIPNFDFSLSIGVKKTFVRDYQSNLAKILIIKGIASEENAFDILKELYSYNEEGKPYPRIDEKLWLDFAQVEYEMLYRAFSVRIEPFENLDLVVKEAQTQAYRFAKKETTKKTYQAMEAFLHNLNTMHCLPYNEELWVYDIVEEELKTISIGDLESIYEPKRYKVISLNQKNGETEMKFINGIQRKDNNRRLITIIDNEGRKVTTTDNHKIMKLNYEGKITEDYPENLQHVLSPRFINLPSSKNDIGLDHYHSRKKQNYLKDHIIITPQFSKLVGYYIADGSIVGGSQLCFTVCDINCEQELINLMQYCYGTDITYNKYPKPNGEPKDIRFNVGKIWTEMFKDKIGSNAYNKKIPMEILLSNSKEINVEFLNGYFKCDGSIKKNYITVSTVNKQLRNEINLMFLKLGELPHIAETITNSNYGQCKSYIVSISGKAENRLSMEFKCNSQYEQKHYDYEFLKEKIKTHNKLIHHNKIKPQDIELYGLNDKDLEVVNNLYPVSINQFIESNSNEEYVYDLSVEDNETFLTAEGIFVHNSRAGAQVPFSSINFGTDVTAEGRLVVEQFLLATEAGLGNGETAIFPISIFRVKEGINYNPEDVNYDLFKLAMRVSAKRLFPNFSFQDAPFNLQYYKENKPETHISYMGCRTRVIGSVFPETDGRVFGRGNLSFSTINLPRLGIKHGIVLGERDKADWDGFYTEFNELIDIVFSQLIERYEIQKKKKVKNFPFLMGQGVWVNSEKLNWEDTLEEVIKHGTLTVGFIGLAETLKAMLGVHHGESEEAQKIGLEIIRHLRKRCDDAAKEYMLNFSVIATPAEGLSGRFVKMDRKIYGNIDGVTDRNYYTNSNHVPVYYPINVAKKIEIEAPYHELTNAGHIFYIELDGDPAQNLDAFELIIRKMKECGIGYGSINHPIDRDPICGFNGVIGDKCPKCGRSESEHKKGKVRLKRICK